MTGGAGASGSGRTRLLPRRVGAILAGGLTRRRSLVLTGFLIIAIEIFKNSIHHVPNPPAFLILAIVFSAFDGGLVAGVASAALSAAYIAWHFSLPGQPFHYDGEDLTRVIIWAVTMPLTAVLVGMLKRRADRSAALLSEKLASEARAEERRATEHVRRESAEWFRRLVETAEEGIWVLDQDGRVLYANERMGQLMGLPARELMGHFMFDFVGDAARAGAKRYFERRRAGISERFEFPMSRRDGTTVWAIVSTKAIMDTDGGFLGSLAMFTDITERKRAEEELRRYNEELERLVTERTEQLLLLERRHVEEEHLAATGRMAARIAHEINNPLAGVKFSFLLLRDAIPVDHPHRGYVETIDHELDRIATIVRGMFDLYRPEEDRPAWFRLSHAAREVVLLLAPGAERAGVTVRVEPGPDPDDVEYTEGTIRQVLFNLVQNAIDASPRGGAVVVETGIADGRIRLAVRDEGPGIPAADAERVWLPFFTTKRGLERTGLGLGLPMTRSLVELMQGDIGFRAAPGGGTIFEVMLPVRRDTGAASSRAAGDDATSAGGAPRPAR